LSQNAASAPVSVMGVICMLNGYTHPKASKRAEAQCVVAYRDLSAIERVKIIWFQKS